MEIKYEDRVYHCGEQLFQWLKCHEMKDIEKADKILQTTDGLEAMKIGNECVVNKFWKNSKSKAMKLTQELKFRQNADSKGALLNSGDEVLILANQDAF